MTDETRPELLVENIPDLIKELPRWMNWSNESRGPGQKPTKIPKQPNGSRASTKDPTTWSTFDEVVEAYNDDEQFTGIGFNLPYDMVGVDLDDQITDGVKDESLTMILSMFDTYAEVSPSGTGVKMLCHGNLSNELKMRCLPRGVEMYEVTKGEEGHQGGRYFTITGQVVDDKHTEIKGCRNAIHSLQTIITDPIGDRSLLKEGSLADEMAMEDKDAAHTLLEHVPADLADYHDSWLRVGMALHHVDPSPHMLSTWEKWSAQSDKFEEGACAFRWNSFGKNLNVNMVGLPHLKRIAEENGYDPDSWNPMDQDMFDFMDEEISQEYLIEGILVEGECCLIGGASKTLKTSVALDLGVSIAMGKPFLGTFNVLHKRNVYIISGESGKATIQKSLDSIHRAKDVNRKTSECFVRTCFELPQLTEKKDRIALVRRLVELECNVVIIDPLYMCMRLGSEASNVYAMGQVMNPILSAFGNAGITPVILHHFRKQGKTFNDPPEMEDFSQSGIAECSRQWLLLKRRGYYESDGKHDLWFVNGGSAGHSGKGVLSVDTGSQATGLHWSPSYHTMADWKMETQKRKLAGDMVRQQGVEYATFEVLQEHESEGGMSVAAIHKDVKNLAPDLEATRADVEESLKALEDVEQVHRDVKGSRVTYYVDQVTASLL